MIAAGIRRSIPRGDEEFCNNLSNSNPAVRRLHNASKGTEGVKNMAKLVFGLQQSLDGYVDHLEMGPRGPALFRHFVEHVRDLAGSVYGRRTYEIMRYWDEDLPEWDAEELDFAAGGEANRSGSCRAR